MPPKRAPIATSSSAQRQRGQLVQPPRVITHLAGAGQLGDAAERPHRITYKKLVRN